MLLTMRRTHLECWNIVTVHRQTAHSATLYAISLSAEALSEICVRSYVTITLTEHWVLPIAVGNLKWQNPLLEHAESNNCTVKQAIYKIRTDSNMQKRYDGFHFLSSRTVLSKGLEFELCHY